MSLFANGIQAFTAQFHLHAAHFSHWLPLRWNRDFGKVAAGADQEERFTSLHRAQLRQPLDADTNYMLTLANIHRTNLLK